MTRRRTPEPKVEVRRCAVYTRKSTSIGLEQDYNSLDAQREACETYIRAQAGWQLIDEQYDDGGFTGANTDRPAFQRLMADVDAGKIDIIVVYKVDRLSRSLLDFLTLMRRLEAAGASFVSVTQNFSTADAMGRLTMNLLASFAEFEREMISERTRDKIAGARRRGKWTGGPTPFGYKLVEKKLIIDELEGQVVRAMFRLFLEHRQVARVARLLNDQKLLPRARKGQRSEGPRWRKEAVARILKSPLYVGQIPHGDLVHAGEHQAIVDDESFARAQFLFDGKGANRLPTGQNAAYLLRGLLRCSCGAMMVPGSTKRGHKRHRYYRCGTRDKFGKQACATTPVPAAAIEEFVAERIATRSEDPEFVAAAKDWLEGTLAARRAVAMKLRKSLPKQIAEASTETKKLSEQVARLRGKAKEAAEEQLVLASDKLVAAERQLAKVGCELEDLANVEQMNAYVIRTLASFAKLWDLMTTENKGRMFQSLIDKVVFNEATSSVEVHLIDFSQGTKEAA